MAPRYEEDVKNDLIKRVKKLLAKGKTVNAACNQISDEEGGRPPAATLVGWARAAGLTTKGKARSNGATTTPNKRRGNGRRHEITEPAPAATAADVTESPSASEPVTDTSTESATTSDIGTDSAPVTEHDAASVTELVVTTPGSSTTDAALDLDDLINENHRLRLALNEANREIRSLRDLVGVYVSR